MVLAAYLMVILFAGLFAHLLYFTVHDAEKVVANAGNKRQDAFSEFVKRGSIQTADGVTVAESTTDGSGNETRSYPCGEMYAHVVGYNKYGRSGIELEENFDLMRSHQNIAEKVYQDLKNEKNTGDTVVLTLNSSLQQAAYDALGSARGAAVVLEPSTGKILAMVSKPAFDPNQIDAVWEEVHSAAGAGSTVLLNRASQGLYAPGSTFKVVTTLEFLREHPDYQNYSYTCTGTGVFNGIEMRCSNRRAHGTVNLQDSLAYSCNTSFSNIGTTLIRADGLHSTAEKLLYNKEIPYEGEISKSSFSLTSSSEATLIPQTVIGQGKTLITPLHNALIISAIANGGEMMQPRLVDHIENADGAIIRTPRNKKIGQVADENLVREIQPMLEAVCQYGTASGYMAGKAYATAGKTGTAETDEKGDTNSWFIGYMPADAPEIAVSVIVEGSNENGITGTSVASRIFDTYASLQK